VPKSRVRRKAAYTPPPAKQGPGSKAPKRWVGPLMVGLFVVGLLWIVLYYILGRDHLPLLGGLGNWNLLIGFAFIIGGIFTATRWE